MDNLDKILEGLLFLSGDGLDRGVIMEKLQVTPKQLDKAVEVLKSRYNEDCGINMITYKDKLQLCASPKYADDVSLVLNPIRERQLTKATLEVMAIIAYKQPVTRIDVQDIRGINSDYAIQTLLNYKLIEVVGRKDAVGKPLLFGTTDEFLRHFGINDLKDLPDYDELMKNVQKIQLENNHLYNEFDIPAEDESNALSSNAETESEALQEKKNEDADKEPIKNEEDCGENETRNVNQSNKDLPKISADEKVKTDFDLEALKSFEDLEIDENMTLEDFDNLLQKSKKDVEEKLNENAEENVDGIDWSLLEDNTDIDFD